MISAAHQNDAAFSVFAWFSAFVQSGLITNACNLGSYLSDALRIGGKGDMSETSGGLDF